MAAYSLALVSLGFSTNSRHWNKPKKNKHFGAFSEQPGKISSPLWQTVRSALHVAISCSVSSERALFSGGLFFFIADLYVMYHICRYFIRCTLTQRQRTWIDSLFFFFSLSFDVRVANLFIFYSNIRPAQLQLQEKSDTTPLCVCVCESACICVCGWYMCMLTMCIEAFCCLYCSF